MQETQVPSLGQEDPLEKEMATHSSILAWRIPWTKELSSLDHKESDTILVSMQYLLINDINNTYNT